jgi:hypothetical protein
MASLRGRPKLIVGVRSRSARDRLLKAVRTLLLERNFESITSTLVSSFRQPPRAFKYSACDEFFYWGLAKSHYGSRGIVTVL